jgi:hypothetical protein
MHVNSMIALLLIDFGLRIQQLVYMRSLQSHFVLVLILHLLQQHGEDFNRRVKVETMRTLPAL